MNYLHGTLLPGKELSRNLDPLARFIANEWIGFLNKLQYPVREPEHYNSAFSMCLAWDYAITLTILPCKIPLKNLLYGSI